MGLSTGFSESKGEEKLTMASLSYKDLGFDCPFETDADIEHELMREFIDHAESDHKKQVLSADVIFKVKNAIKK